MAKQQFRLLAGQVVTRDRSKPILDADGRPVPGRFEQKVIRAGGTVESDKDLAAAEPGRYQHVGGPSDAARVRELERELSDLKAKAAAPSAPAALSDPSVFPGGQVSTGFQATSGGQSGPLSPEDAERLQGKEDSPARAPKDARAPREASPRGRSEADLNAMTVHELRELAAEEEVDLHGATRKEDLVRALQKSR